MKFNTAVLSTLIALTTLASAGASAQVLIDSGKSNRASTSGAIAQAPMTGGDVRAPSPRIQDPSREGYMQFAVGPAYGIGFESDSLMYNVMASYNWNYDEHFTWKALADLYTGAGSVSSQLVNIGAGADLYLPEMDTDYGTPYFNGEVAIGQGRNAVEQTAVGATLGAGTGFKFRAQDLNWDIGLQYSFFTATVGNTKPSIVALRAGLNF